MNDNALNTPNTETNNAAFEDPWAAASAPASEPTSADATASAADADPWAASYADANTGSGSDAWSGGDAASQVSSTDWLSAPSPTDVPEHDGGIGQLWHQITTEGLPVQDSINNGLTWVVDHFRPFFQAVRTPIDATLNGVTDVLQTIPMPALVLLIALLAWQFAGRKLAIGSAVALLCVALLGIWSEAMVTLALVLTSLFFCIAIGLPVGILLASSDLAQRWTRPFLDAMQTTPAFVYLVPVVMLFGIGNVPGVIVTIVFALPPLIRLTNLGIRQVRPDLIEASRAYGASPAQLLWKVQLPLAMPSIMAGINQALMLSLSMVVIASMIAVGGLGQMVLRGIGRLDMGLATVGGLGIVLLAIVLDRITQAMGEPKRGSARWWATGPAGLVMRLLDNKRSAPAPKPGSETAKPATI
ncbi:ABC transporter permease [Comamonas testosteroni TK102]|uniref:ABC transporter permease n=1 Tax=Comamonas testosteroni TK102 TaxID=1392005 RepID=A0A076PGH8_COMTE|nr:MULTISPECIES: glycine betaine/L-proline ABC transporter permease ProW [Comamonas]AIJ45869.1 ABC transporter permease [Comamonas testosteroni TK102]MPS87168.1 glycine betaine/L-proline ABC transporter permease ProW [Comamonas sp.]